MNLQILLGWSAPDLPERRRCRSRLHSVETCHANSGSMFSHPCTVYHNICSSVVTETRKHQTHPCCTLQACWSLFITTNASSRSLLDYRSTASRCHLVHVCLVRSLKVSAVKTNSVSWETFQNKRLMSLSLGVCKDIFLPLWQ